MARESPSLPRKTRELAAVAIICVLTVIGLICASVGAHILPKCRYGSPDCYFIVEICAYSDIKNAPDTPGTTTQSVRLAARPAERSEITTHLRLRRSFLGSPRPNQWRKSTSPTSASG
jgi:hypothetical protein